MCIYIYNVNFVCHVQMSKHIYKKPSQDNGPFSCDVRDIHKDIFEGKPTQNLNFKQHKQKVTLNISNRILKKKKKNLESKI